ncbi:molybdopterin-dependent oxidoreductase [Roseateles saccharophilus]|uniref:Sulfite dehydrogenase (Cytochrome) subunit SorA apoprotein n=1 Tax=Roseateles saccharophilus TaxID=304 RepID=A0A4R3UZE2_ROSSA|nr:molybdopterin-dependent oxidoreductase [Roseateles saccharophilus]MDG0835278.1 oxidase [Roseateles saccharophilus]TCU96187.1 sulfite dehydrogenase (cytochrome) subunit SorA apoprotein [Roseateles saccharophilus]
MPDHPDPSRLSRRSLLGATGLAGLAAHLPAWAQAGAPQTFTHPFANGERRLVAYPEKRPLIVLSSRPPQLETPFEVFNDGPITPNDAFFVRYHNAGIPTSIDADTHQIKIFGNAVAKPFALSMAELKTGFRPVEITAVNQCSGNGRGLFNPRVTGGQLANGAMGNARWLGVPLKDVLARAELKNTARQVTFNGLDEALFGGGDFVKALDIAHAMDGEVMLAWQMNGADIPFLNGYPVKLIVPGYYGTYWVKHLSEIEVIDSVFDGFWMKPAYRVPDNDCACIEPGTTPAATRPIARFNVRSFITSVADGARLPAGAPLAVKGIAFDGGQGIREVAFSTDGGASWRAATLGADLGRYSFREFRFGFTPAPGQHDLRVRAWNRSGQSQPMEALWQPAGYMRNVVESVRISAV